jgi:hypothetical protein
LLLRDDRHPPVEKLKPLFVFSHQIGPSSDTAKELILKSLLDLLQPRCRGQSIVIHKSYDLSRCSSHPKVPGDGEVEHRAGNQLDAVSETGLQELFASVLGGAEHDDDLKQVVGLALKGKEEPLEFVPSVCSVNNQGNLHEASKTCYRNTRNPFDGFPPKGSHFAQKNGRGAIWIPYALEVLPPDVM